MIHAALRNTCLQDILASAVVLEAIKKYSKTDLKISKKKRKGKGKKKGAGNKKRLIVMKNTKQKTYEILDAN
jgi:hypothetical protein